MQNARRILILEGDDALAQRAATYFRGAGWSPVIARDAMRAVSAAREAQPEVIVMNASLPGGAMQALTRLKASIRTAAVPVVAITEVPEVYLKAGAQHCAPDMTDLVALEKAASGCCARPTPVLLAPKAVIEDAPRLAALRKSGLLDPASEPLLDALTRLGARLVGSPVTLVSLVDRDRQFFKSQSGLQPPLSTARQTDLSHSFCQWVVSGEEPLAVADARDHPVLGANLAVRELGVVAYLGVPLKTSGQPVGSFCAVNTVPQQWSETDLRTLSHLACVVETFGLPGDAAGIQVLDVVARALEATGAVLAEAGGRLERTERELLWQIVQRLGQRLAAIKSW